MCGEWGRWKDLKLKFEKLINISLKKFKTTINNDIWYGGTKKLYIKQNLSVLSSFQQFFFPVQFNFSQQGNEKTEKQDKTML